MQRVLHSPEWMQNSTTLSWIQCRNWQRSREAFHLNVVSFCAEIKFFTQYFIFFQCLSSSTDSTDLAASNSAFPGTCWQRMFLANWRRIAFFSNSVHAFLGTVPFFSGRLETLPSVVVKAEINVTKVTYTAYRNINQTINYYIQWTALTLCF